MRYFHPPADTGFYVGVDLHARSLFLVVLDHRAWTIRPAASRAERDAPFEE